jgi:hypothetical protein
VRHFAGHLLVEDKGGRTPGIKSEVLIIPHASTASKIAKIRAQQ